MPPWQLRKVGERGELKHCSLQLNECSTEDTCGGLPVAESQVWGEGAIFPGELIGVKSEKTSTYLVRIVVLNAIVRCKAVNTMPGTCYRLANFINIVQ